jgi:hypothetical protein
MHQAPPITHRAVFIGFALSVVVAFWGQFAAMEQGYAYLTYPHLPACLLIPFFLLILVPDIAVAAIRPQHALTTTELLVIFSMGLVASTVPDWGVIRYLMVIISGPYYFITPENQWAAFQPYLPEWLLVHSQVSPGYIEGLVEGVPIPWMPWIIPLFWWFSFYAALFWMGACVVVILRKQWVEHERLRFPLGEVAMRLIGVERVQQGAGIPVLFQSRMFHIGFSLAFLTMAWNVLSYWDVTPRIPITGDDVYQLRIAREFPAVPIYLNLLTLSLSYFVNVEVLFSVWFFELFSIIERGVLNQFGIGAATGAVIRGGLVSVQSVGGLVVFTLWGLWMARGHIREVVRQVLHRTNTLDDSSEFFSYRVALIGLLAGLIYTVFWLYQAGLAMHWVLLLLLFTFIFYLALARIVAEAGLATIDLPINAHEFTVGIAGSGNLSISDLTVTALGSGFARNWRAFTMVAPAHVAWMGARHRLTGRQLFRWIALAFLLSLMVSTTYAIQAGYSYGAQNLRDNYPTTIVGFYNMIPIWKNNARQITFTEIEFFLLGGGLVMALTFARYALTWWPLHPIGFAVTASQSIILPFFTFFMAWLIQTLILRIGGVQLYRRGQPLFLGILVGYVVGLTLSYGVDLIWFPGTPHLVERYF